MAKLRVFTRQMAGNAYPANRYPQRLADSVHFALSESGAEYEVLNQNYGILFAKAGVSEDNTIFARGLRNPKMKEYNGEYFIIADYVDCEGNAVEETMVVCYKTKDFVHFSEIENCSREAVCVEGLTEEIDIPEELVKPIRERWIPLQAQKVILPSEIQVHSLDELDQIRAQVVYSDESVDVKPIFWRKESLQKVGDGLYTIQGEMEAVTPVFPLTVGFADPVVFQWEEKWYYIATNDNLDDIGLYVRRANSVKELFEENAETNCILDYDENRELCQTFWAPEFHVIGGELYILFAVSPKEWGPQCHMMKLRRGGDILNPADWSDPIRVRKMDGSFLADQDITLDMTYFKVKEQSYLLWSYRQNIGTPKDSGSMLCIATTNEKEPWVLTSDPVVISRPMYAWENHSGTINNEGPYPLILGDKIYIAYSGGDACGPAYVVGYLMSEVDKDLLNVNSWEKEPTAMLHLQSVEGILGPGHNSFFVDEYGRRMIAYHAQERAKNNCRCSTYHRVHIAKSGLPMLNVVGERDLPEVLRKVEISFEMK